MAPFATIYTYPNNFRVQRAQVIAALNNLELSIPDFQMGTTNTTPEFLSKFPLGKVPALESADGSLCIAEGAAISTYLALSGPKAPQLLGADIATKARIAEWTFFTESELVAHATVALLTLIGYVPYDAGAQAAAAGRFERALGKVEGAVKGGRRFLVGEELTLADLMVVSALYMAGGPIFDAEMRAKVPATVAYLKGISAIPEFAKVFGEWKPCEKRVSA